MKDWTEARQTGALMFCALSVIGAMQWAVLPPWITVPAALAAALLWTGADKRQTDHGEKTRGSRLLAGGAWLTSVAVLALGTKLAISAYPSAAHGEPLGVILLALAIWAARRGRKVLLRTGALLFWFLLILYILIGAFSLEQITPRPVTEMPIGPWWLLPLALLPAAYIEGTETGRIGGRWHLLWALILILPGILCALTLGPQRAAREPFGLYTLSKSVTILNVMERFEVLVSAAETAGGYCLLGSVAEYAHRQVEGAGFGAGKLWWGVLFLAAAGGTAAPEPWLGATAGTLAAIFWGVRPAVTQGMVVWKKVRKK